MHFVDIIFRGFLDDFLRGDAPMYTWHDDSGFILSFLYNQNMKDIADTLQSHEVRQKYIQRRRNS